MCLVIIANLKENIFTEAQLRMNKMDVSEEQMVNKK